MNERMEPLELGGELFELVVRRKDELAPYQPIFMTYPEINEWRTRDLFRKHPNKYLWTFQGRKDDVIVLSNGEKFNPVTTELIVSGHPLVAGALVVGSGRELCGLLLESRDNKAVELVEAVWPAVLDANKIAPGHGKIMRNMIRVLSPEQRFIRAPKGTIIRSLSTVNLEAVIMDLYEYTTTVPSSPSVSNTTLSEETILWHLRQAVASQLGRIPADEEDLFASAFDSLQATYLAGTLSKDFSGQLKSEKVSPKLIYENPSMMMMTHALISLLRSTETAKIDADAMIPNTATRSEPGNVSSIIQIKRMQSLVTRFSESFPKAAKTTLPRNNKLLNILITGTTGFLGSHLLRVLLKDPSVGKIVCFNRSDSGESAFRRHCTEDLHRIVFVKVAFGTDEFGLPHDIFQDLTETIDIIIHSAWKVGLSLYVVTQYG